MGKLVLRRKLNQTIVVNDNITFTIERINGNRVAISVDAPNDYPIRRGEYQKQNHENQDIRTDTIGEQITGDTTNDIRSTETSTP
jgi:carbon storage regulator CsrA